MRSTLRTEAETEQSLEGFDDGGGLLGTLKGDFDR